VILKLFPSLRASDSMTSSQGWNFLLTKLHSRLFTQW
jgi:hypothetical protein